VLVVNVEPNENTERAPPLSNPEHRLNRGRLSRSVYRLGDHKSEYAQVAHVQRVAWRGLWSRSGIIGRVPPESLAGIHFYRDLSISHGGDE